MAGILVSGTPNLPAGHTLESVSKCVSDSLPDAHLALVREIHFAVGSPPGSTRRFSIDNIRTWGERAGEWHGKERRIVLYDVRGHETITGLLETVFHEVAHAVYESLAPEIIELWKVIYYQAVEERIFLESSEGREQDFSECYAGYILHGAEFKERCPQKYDFLRAHIFDGRSYIDSTRDPLPS